MHNRGGAVDRAPRIDSAMAADLGVDKVLGRGATPAEVAIPADGDDGLLAGYSEVLFLGPVRAGDALEATAEVATVVVPGVTP